VMTDQSGEGADAGGVQLIGNEFAGTVAATPTCQLTPPYSYSHILQSVADGVAAVKAGAGATLEDPLNFEAVPTALPSMRAAEKQMQVRRTTQGIFVRASGMQSLRVDWYGLGGDRVLRSESVEMQPGWNALKNPPTASGAHVYGLRGAAGANVSGILLLP